MIKYKLRPYQQEAVDKFYKNSMNVGYYFDPGLGKSVTALKTVEKVKAKALIITAPKLLLDVWIKEIRNATDWDCNIITWDSTKVKTKKFQAAVSEALQSEKLLVLLTNVEAFSTENKNLLRLFKAVAKKENCLWVMDEATKIKNASANRTKRILKLSPLVNYKTSLTGTDVSTSPLNLYTMLEWQHANFWYPLRNFWQFKNRYAILKEITLNNSRGSAKIIVGYKKLDELMQKIDPVIFRAKKENVAPELPEKVITDIQVPMNSDQIRIYKELKDLFYCEYKDQEVTISHKVTLFIRLRQVIAGFMPETGKAIGNENNKIEFIKEDTEENESKIIIWANFTKAIDALHNALPNSVTFYGENTADYNNENKDRFKSDPEIKYFIANPSSGSMGLNLEFAPYQYFFDLPASSENYYQALDRSHRITSKDTVFYKRLYTPGTVEEKLLKSIDQKIELMNLFHTQDFNTFMDNI